MLNRVTISALLKSVLLGSVDQLGGHPGIGAWGSWQKVGTADGIAAVAEASTHFQGAHNLRSDRARTFRVLMAEKSPRRINER